MTAQLLLTVPPSVAVTVVLPEVALPAVRTPALTVTIEVLPLCQVAVVVSVACVPPAVVEVDDRAV
jgi:hypothetical protein